MTAHAISPLRPPWWLPPASLTLAVLGLADSAYLIYEHFTDSSTLACSDSGAMNCAKITTSQWSHFLGMPVTLLGLIFFMVMTLLCLPAVWRHAPRLVNLIRTIIAASGLVMVFYLLWAEFFNIHAICLWCTSVHMITFVLFFTLIFGEILRSTDSPDPDRANQC